ncbi:MAG: F0F1 ATP synthase subunit A [Flavobacteriales bacterium]|nr:F0F1 ATP synthase subunit A [Flavobacteriales bacterium]
MFAFTSLHVSASEGHGEEAFNAGDMIIHHIVDAHSIHLGTFSIPLPVILYTEQGIDIFSSGNFVDGHHQAVPYTSTSTGNTYVLEHEHIYYADEHGHVKTEMVKDDKGNDVETKMGPMDFSITKSVLGMFLIIFLMILVFRAVASGYKKRAGQAPKGIQNLFEPLILFIRDEVAIPSIGEKKADRYTPFLLTVFFFIWMCNMLGLIPFIGGFNITGTMSITLVLAAIVFIITTVSGNKHYWGHILWPPGVPLPIKFILVPIEFASIFIKPAVLMVRLTANITAGHIIILAFVSLVILFGEQGQAIGAGVGVGIGAVLFMVFMFFIELLVAFLQAYVFTLLAALYFGDATQDGHH